jgi:hypothetical protein
VTEDVLQAVCQLESLDVA